MSYCHFSLVERSQIELMQQQGLSRAEMARVLGRHPSSIGRELRRNGGARGYCAMRAQGRYGKRRTACRPKDKLSYGPLRDYVADKIALAGWSPELVAGRLAMDHPDRPRMRLCHETIYRAVYRTGHYLDFLRGFLPQARPKRRKRSQGKHGRASLIPNRVGIAERPAAVDARIEQGHWEGDLIVGKGQDGFIVTLVERTARLLHAVKTHTRKASEVRRAVVAALIDRPVSWVKTITFDNGSEFAQHQAMTDQLGARVYFADPYSAYQRGSNEQVNGLIRRVLPKGTPFEGLSQQQLDTIVQRINNRPRKCLAYRTPNEIFQQQRIQHLRALRT